MRKILSHIPGFRSRTPWHMIVAGVYYICAFAMMLVSIALGVLLLSGPFLLLNSHIAMEEYSKNKNTKALVSLLLTAALCGGGLIGFVADMSHRHMNDDPMDTVVRLETVTPSDTPNTALTATPAPEPSPSPSPTPGSLPLENAIVLRHTDGPCLEVQFEDETTKEIRYAGIEIGGSIREKAVAYVAKMLPPGTIVYLERGMADEISPTGYYVWMDRPIEEHPGEVCRKMLNALLVAKGLAAPSEDQHIKYAMVLTACQEAACAAGAGLWAAAIEATASPSAAPTLRQTPAPTQAPAPTPAPAPEITPAPTPVPEATPLPPPPGEIQYCGSKNSEVFHLSTCGSASQINPENLVIYSSREDAISQGKRPCKRCNP